MHLRMNTVTTGETLQEHGARISDVYFPERRRVLDHEPRCATARWSKLRRSGAKGMLGIGVFFGDRSGAGRTFQQVGRWSAASRCRSAQFIKEIAMPGPLREVVGLYAQANLLQTCSAPRATPYTT